MAFKDLLAQVSSQASSCMMFLKNCGVGYDFMAFAYLRTAVCVINRILPAKKLFHLQVCSLAVEFHGDNMTTTKLRYI